MIWFCVLVSSPGHWWAFLLTQLLAIARGQRQVMHQIDNLSNLVRDYAAERSQQGRSGSGGRAFDLDSVTVPLLLALALGGFGVFLFRSLNSQRWPPMALGGSGLILIVRKWINFILSVLEIADVYISWDIWFRMCNYFPMLLTNK